MPAARHDSIYDAFVAPAQRDAAFDPAHSPLNGQVAFIVGAPRSGTTWLQQLLYVHPDLATGGESHLFCEGLPEVFGNFAHANGMSHLSTWVSRAELLHAARAFCDAVFVAQRDGTRPGARMVLEKTPNHRLQAALQATLYPDARYVHIVRDGRDATASQRQLWGSRTEEFADADRAAGAWADSIRDIRRHFGELAYIELRYEDIIADTALHLGVIFEHLGLAYDDALLHAAAAFGAAPVHTSPESPHVGIRKHAGDTLAEASVARAAGDLLVELGYASDAEVAEAAQRRVPRASSLTNALTRVRSRRARADEAEVRRIADATARDLVGDTTSLPHLRGARITQRRVSGGSALVTFVTEQGARVVVRISVRGTTATVEEL